MPLKSFPSIDQFRHAVTFVEQRATYVGRDDNQVAIYDPALPKPVLTFTGTPKLHGANLGLRFDLSSDTVLVRPQSREQFLVPDSRVKGGDLFGFAAWTQGEGAAAVLCLHAAVLDLLAAKGLSNAKTVHVYGELCSPHVNIKAAIGKAMNGWMVLDVCVTDQNDQDIWLPVSGLASAWAGYSLDFISRYPSYELAIDFNDPEACLDELERLTLAVEACCPVAKALGVEGIGEGIVWCCDHPLWGRILFKTKGRKHKGTKSVRLVEITPEVIASRQAFVEAVLTESRLEQGLDRLRALYGVPNARHLGEFLRWVGLDVMKEEADTLSASGLDRKDVMGLINRQAKAWVTPCLVQDRIQHPASPQETI